MSWLTPSEIFSPYYGGALAECILSDYIRSGKSEPLQIYELGAGTGTVARDMLDYVQTHAPDVYRTTRYTTVEISENLARLQHEKVTNCIARPFLMTVFGAEGACGGGGGGGHMC